jgi:hypothetical protein
MRHPGSIQTQRQNACSSLSAAVLAGSPESLAEMDYRVVWYSEALRSHQDGLADSPTAPRLSAVCQPSSQLGCGSWHKTTAIITPPVSPSDRAPPVDQRGINFGGNHQVLCLTRNLEDTCERDISGEDYRDRGARLH